MKLYVNAFIKDSERNLDVFLSHTYDEDGKMLYYIGECKHVFDVNDEFYLFYNHIKLVKENTYYWIYWKNYIECKIYEPTFTELQII